MGASSPDRMEAEEFSPGSLVWVSAGALPPKASVAGIPWLMAKITSKAGDEDATVEIEVESQDSLKDIFAFDPVTVSAASTFLVPIADLRARTCDDNAVEDLVSLALLHEASCLETLGLRYLVDDIYTYSGQILIAINPFKPLKHLYGPTMMTR